MKFFFCLYLKQEIQWMMYVVYGLIWHWFVETYRLLFYQLIVFSSGKAFEF